MCLGSGVTFRGFPLDKENIFGRIVWAFSKCETCNGKGIILVEQKEINTTEMIEKLEGNWNV